MWLPPNGLAFLFWVMYISLEGKIMPTSSIKKNFNVVGTRRLESFVKAVDRSLKFPVSVGRVKADVLSGIDDLRKLALLREKHGFTY